MIHPKDPQEDEADKVGDDESRVDHAIGGCIHIVRSISPSHNHCHIIIVRDIKAYQEQRVFVDWP